MPTFVLYPLALLGLLTAVAFAMLLVLVLVEQCNAKSVRRDEQRRTRV